MWFPTIVGTPKSSKYRLVFHYKPSILGYAHLWKRPYVSVGCDSELGDSIV